VARVLVVDDSSFMRKRMIKSLEGAGHEVIGQARDGAQAFELYRSLCPDFVVMDITMRGTDGITGARMIKALDPEARILFVSIVTDQEVRQKALALGALGFIGKNEHDRLLEIIG